MNFTGAGAIAITIGVVLFISYTFNIDWFYECALARLPFFMCGVLLFIHPKDDTLRHICLIYGIAFIISVILYSTGKVATYIVAYMTAPFVFLIVSWFVEKISIYGFLNRILKWLGEHSIELYTANVCICSLMKVFNLNIVVETILYFLFHFILVPLFIYVNNVIKGWSVPKNLDIKRKDYDVVKEIQEQSN